MAKSLTRILPCLNSAHAQSAPSVPVRDRQSDIHLQRLAADGGGDRRLMRAQFRFEQLAGLFGGHRLAEIPSLPDRSTEAKDGVVRILILDALDAHRH